MGEANRATLRTKEHYSVFSYNTEGLEPSFTTMVSTGFEPVILRTKPSFGIEPIFIAPACIIYENRNSVFSCTSSSPPCFPVLRGTCLSYVHVKTEFSAFLRMLPTKELTDTFVSLFFCLSVP